MVRSASAVTVVSTLSELFDVSRSAALELTLAELVIVPGSGGALTFRVILGAEPTSRLGRVQVTTSLTSPHVQPSPTKPVKVVPGCRVSVTVTTEAALGPVLVMLSV